jgi:tRNA threonylcarbamoyl adenosine modification protein (Sua5/YciO/YrdC/YwlC family)
MVSDDGSGKMEVEIHRIDPYNLDQKVIVQAADTLRKGGVIVYPTDTIYGLGADILNRDAVSRLFKIKRVSTQKLLSLIFSDLKDIANWAHIPNNVYRVMRRVLPGPYTFILPASKELPRNFLQLQKRRTVGIRVPDSPVARSLVDHLGRPLLSTSVPKGSDDFFTDPQEIADQYRHDIDQILDIGILPTVPSTVVDFTISPPEIIREGAGDIDALF